MRNTALAAAAGLTAALLAHRAEAGPTLDAANKMTFKPVVVDKVDEMRTAFFADRGDVFMADISALYATRAAYAPNPNDYLILPQAISTEPLGPMVRHGDNQFTDGLNAQWTRGGMLYAPPIR